MKSISAGKLQASTSSAAKIYLDMDIPEVKKKSCQVVSNKL
jgi:hypothetical protein